MTRNDFIKMCGYLGIALPLPGVLTSCKKDDGPVTPDEKQDKVLVIGAGPAGMTAGHLLAQQGVDFQILEALPNPGGRIKTNKTFVDFPIPLGAEWLHVERSVFDEIVNDPSVDPEVNTVGYNPATDVYINSENGEPISLEEVGFSIDRKFVDYSWLDFFSDYVLPNIQSRILYNKPVVKIDYSGDLVKVSTQDGMDYTADKIIFTVPLRVLQSGDISFVPALPAYKQNAINTTQVWSGFKAFFEFKEVFYPTLIGFDIQPPTLGQKMFYNASYGQNTAHHVLGVFSTGAPAELYIYLSDDLLKDYILNELDELFENQATPNYIKHVTQNWNGEPYAQGAYLSAHEDASKVRDLEKTIDNKVFFAGDSYTSGDDWSSVHAAARSAIKAVDKVLV
ncbi:NAD(P)/FAD-dependent oxidoreductase [Seonamhaeicola sp.]|uniref:flavin monoamine oxidase family protein n=1 Tax=Seonamhaeicola sp. TaxID=1912245 RepID=UPI0026243927|nr:NAD(P)/FAD-dependent oxidoreductase [Seonamhaeicola sp.]